MIMQWEPILKEVISEVLETMFFALVEFDVDSENRPFSYESEIYIFNHVGKIAISFQVSGEFARMITANLLGINEAQVKEEDLQDTLRELANMVGGNYQARMKDHNWRLGIPSARKLDEECGTHPGTTELIFGCFGEPMGAAAVKFMPVAA